jgi:hypothetical protein
MQQQQQQQVLQRPLALLALLLNRHQLEEVAAN